LADSVRVSLALAVVVLLVAMLGVVASRSSGQARRPTCRGSVRCRARVELPALDRPVRGREADLNQPAELSRAPGGRFVLSCGAG